MNRTKMFESFTKEELKLLDSLDTPWKIQQFINSSINYTYGKRRCPLNVLRDRKADCLDAAVFACAVLTYHRVHAFLLDLRAVNDEDHVLCLYKFRGHYGSVAMSKFVNLKYRNPVYKSVRELAISYFDGYYSFFGRFSLREYSLPFHLGKRYGKAWLDSDRVMKRIEKDIDHFKHFRFFHKDLENKIAHVDQFKFWREIKVLPKKFKVGKIYTNFKKQHYKDLQIK